MPARKPKGRRTLNDAEERKRAKIKFFGEQNSEKRAGRGISLVRRAEGGKGEAPPDSLLHAGRGKKYGTSL